MKVALFGPLPWHMSRSRYSAWERMVARLSRALSAQGVEVARWPADGDGPSGDTGCDEARAIRALSERSGDVDLVHNHAECLLLGCAEAIRAPIVTTVPMDSSEAAVALYAQAGRRSAFVATSTASRFDGLDYLADLPGGVELEHLPPIRKPEGHVALIGLEAADAAQLKAAAELVARAGLEFRSAEREGPDALASASVALHLGPLEPYACDVLDALAAGVPVVALESPGLQELIDAETGVLARSRTELPEAMRQAARLDRRACRERVGLRFDMVRCARAHEQAYASVVDAARRERVDRRYDSRPWGEYFVLEDAPTFKVKRIEVLPGKRLSYQRHERRSEHWMIVRGRARVTLDGELIERTAGETIDIPAGCAHRIENPGSEPLTFIEIQSGTYFGEDDIVRLSDDFGRAGGTAPSPG
jgi:mannose-6-phosphate isomerase-like protein (cupin superfamily)